MGTNMKGAVDAYNYGTYAEFEAYIAKIQEDIRATQAETKMYQDKTRETMEKMKRSQRLALGLEEIA